MALGYFAESTDLMTATIGYSYEYASGYVPTMQDMIQLACTAAYTMIMFLVGYLSLVRRIKAGTMWKNSVLYAFADSLEYSGETEMWCGEWLYQG